jgi:hypothetical protein
MSRGPCTFRQRDVTAAIKAAVAGGLQIGRVEVARDGRIVLISDKQEPTVDKGEANEWDRV